MIAVTIGVGANFERLAEMAAHICFNRTGLETVVLGLSEMKRFGLSKPHHLKFKLFEVLPTVDSILYFDADIIFVQEVDPTRLIAFQQFVCVNDIKHAAWIQIDAADIGISVDEYFNSGFFVAHRSMHLQMFHLAGRLQGRMKKRTIFEDQTYLNAARFWLDIPAVFLPHYYNYLRFEDAPDPENVYVGHLSSIPERRPEIQKRYYQYWGTWGAAVRGNLDPEPFGLLERELIYERIGFGKRRMTLLPNGRIGLGSAGCERRWLLTREDGLPTLWIIGDHHPTCALVQTGTHTWSGRWMHSEEMPVRIYPQFAPVQELSPVP